MPCFAPFQWTLSIVLDDVMIACSCLVMETHDIKLLVHSLWAEKVMKSAVFESTKYWQILRSVTLHGFTRVAVVNKVFHCSVIILTTNHGISWRDITAPSSELFRKVLSFTSVCKGRLLDTWFYTPVAMRLNETSVSLRGVSQYFWPCGICVWSLYTYENKNSFLLWRWLP